MYINFSVLANCNITYYGHADVISPCCGETERHLIVTAVEDLNMSKSIGKWVNNNKESAIKDTAICLVMCVFLMILSS